MIAAIKSSYVMLVPVNPDDVPNNCVFLDETQGNQVAIKTNMGGVSNVVGAESLLFKPMITAQAISIHQPVGKLSNGKIVPAESDVPGQTFIGFALTGGANDGDPVNVLLIGANIAYLLAGKGFTTGQTVYLSMNTGEYTNDPSTLADPINNVIKVGIADCLGGIASSVATDLITFVEKIAEPT